MFFLWQSIYVRDNRCTAGTIFLLHSESFVFKKKALVFIIDYEKAYDTVNHDHDALVEPGVSCQIIKLIKFIYANVKSCINVSANMSMSEFRFYHRSQSRRIVIAPVIISLYKNNDIVKTANINNLTGKVLNILSMFMNLFTDDNCFVFDGSGNPSYAN